MEGLLGSAFEIVLVVDVHEPEAGGVAFGPLEVICMVGFSGSKSIGTDESMRLSKKGTAPHKRTISLLCVIYSPSSDHTM